MPYTDEQKRQHIAEIQRYLQYISERGGDIPQTVSNGIYDSNTENAVREFQRRYGLDVTGEVNGDTWDEIVRVYRSYLETKPEPLDIFPSGKYICKNGDSGELVYVIQVLLKELSRRYDNMPDVAVNGEFTDDTASAVREFQQKTGLPQNGEVNCETWNMLVKSI